MSKPKLHILVCASFRVSGEPKGACHKKGSVSLLPYLESEISDRGIEEALVSSCGCMKACDHGPVMVLYPQNVWYGGVDSEDAVDEILDAIEDGDVAESYLIQGYA